MKTKSKPANVLLLIFLLTLFAVTFTTLLHAQNATNTASAPITRTASTHVRNADVYSVRFPGGEASEFFNFWRTNGFPSDTILFAGRAGEVIVPAFTVNRVRLKEIAKSIELVTENQLEVEVVEEGEQSDVNIWRIKLADAGGPVKTRACGMPYLLGSPGAGDKVAMIVDRVSRALERVMEVPGRSRTQLVRGSTHTLEAEKVVVVVGSESYVEAVALALDAAERVAAVEAENRKPH